MTEQERVRDSDRPGRQKIGSELVRWIPSVVLLGSIIASFVTLKAEAGETQRRVDRLEQIQQEVGDLRRDVSVLTSEIRLTRASDERMRVESERRIGDLERTERERRRLAR